MTSHCIGPSVYDLQGTMSSIVERYRAGRSVSQVSVQTFSEIDQFAAEL